MSEECVNLNYVKRFKDTMDKIDTTINQCEQTEITILSFVHELFGTNRCLVKELPRVENYKEESPSTYKGIFATLDNKMNYINDMVLNTRDIILAIPEKP